MVREVNIFSDGGSRGNPGPGGAGYVIKDSGGEVIEGAGVFLGKVTNNAAEYSAVIRALEAAGRLGARKVNLFSDSELLVKQINGVYRVKNANLRVLFDKCVRLLKGFDSWRVSHIYRESNEEADGLANKAMDAKRDVSYGGARARAESGVGSEADSSGGRRVKLGVLLSGGGRTMQNIQEKIEAGALNAEISVVISSRTQVKGVERAGKIGCPVEIVRRKDFSDIGSFSGRIGEILDSFEVDLVIQAGWLCLWRIPEGYKGRVMNIHPALLPSFGGKGMWGHNVHEAVLERGCKVSGCTVHFCTNEYDEGPIIVQRCCEVREGDDADSLAGRVFGQECVAYPEAIRLFSEGKLEICGGVVKVG